MKSGFSRIVLVAVLTLFSLASVAAGRGGRWYPRRDRRDGAFRSPPAERPAPEVVNDRNLFRGAFRGGAGTLNYCQFAENTDLSGETFLVLILHGRSGSGSDNLQQLATPALRPLLEYVRAERIKAVLLLPQCPERRGWIGDGMFDMVVELVSAKCREFGVSEKHCLLTGFSMGGGACYPLMAQYPGRFARALVVSAGGFPDMAKNMRGDFYIAIGAEDRVVQPANAERMASALRANGCSTRLEILPGKDHVDGGAAAYRGDARNWLFRIRK